MPTKEKNGAAKRSGVQKTMDEVSKRAQKMGSRIVQVAQETPQYISLRRQEHGIRAELDDELKAIGKRVRSLHRSAKKNSPFERYSAIMQHLETIERLEKEFSQVRVKLNTVKEEMRGKGRR